MNDRITSAKPALSIAAVERDTGLLKDTLRVWERRYGFPTPERDSFGERCYSLEQVEKLRVIRRLIDAGHRPGRIMGLAPEQLQALVAAAAPTAVSHDDEQTQSDLQFYLSLVKTHQIEELRRSLGQVLMRQGLESFVVDVAAPLNRMIGEAWVRGQLEIFEEHLYTESMQIILRGSIGSAPAAFRGPKILLTTFPQESHGLGLLMAEALMVLEGARCISLGTMTPIWDIVLASTSQNVDVVALSFSAAMSPNILLDGLKELRSKLPVSTEIWAGGNSPVLIRKPPKGVLVISDLAQIKSTVVAWRRARSL